MYITDNVYLIYTREKEREKKRKGATRKIYRYRRGGSICAIESLYNIRSWITSFRSTKETRRHQTETEKYKKYTLMVIVVIDGYSPIIYHFLSTRMRPRPNNAGLYHVRDTKKFIWTWEKENITNEARNDWLHDYVVLRNETHKREREENSYRGGKKIA